MVLSMSQLQMLEICQQKPVFNALELPPDCKPKSFLLQNIEITEWNKKRHRMEDENKLKNWNV